MREDPEFRSMDLIVPVPLHRSRERERGYNQSALVARGLGQILGVPVSPRALRRNRGTRTQTELSAEERARNVEGAFEVRDPGKVAGLRVLLVDDVLTTGATLDAGAAALRKAGARQVYAAAVASPFRS
jgi:ComF family protein